MARPMIETLETREQPSALPADFVPHKPVDPDAGLTSFTPPIGSNKGSQIGGHDVQTQGIIAILIG